MRRIVLALYFDVVFQLNKCVFGNLANKESKRREHGICYLLLAPLQNQLLIKNN